MIRNSTSRVALRLPVVLGVAAMILGMPIALSACDKDETSTKTTTTKTTVTPESVKKTTETTEKKVETEHKNP